VHLVSLYFLTSRGIDYGRGEVRSVSINYAYNYYLLPVTIVRRLLILTLLIESLIKDSFSLSNNPNYKSLLVYIIGVLKENVKFLNFFS
jgi:hypothetical protein